MIAEAVVETLRKKYQLLKSELDERGRRLWAASESLALGRGGLQAVVEATGLGDNTIRRGCRELQATREASATVRRIRRRGGGRKPLTTLDRELFATLEGLVEPTARGDPMSPLRWTCKSPRRLATELRRQGHRGSHTKVAQLLEWYHMGSKVYPQAVKLLIMADGGGSNASRNRLWKVELQRLADATGLTIQVCHFPPGTSKWNKIEHRMFCHITENWRGKPLTDHAVIVNLIGHTTTAAGLTIQAELDQGTYPTGIKVPDQQMQTLSLHPADFHGHDWNYSIEPRLAIKPSVY